MCYQCLEEVVAMASDPGYSNRVILLLLYLYDLGIKGWRFALSCVCRRSSGVEH